ncbi:hypothetical protein PF005_g775 [Phytophthora fragariae]|uniref:WRKY19-like zinc finger domain-containing protein n=1 Tax=Phytophthora fragariae TaxID=53985 RepID=A0A6A4F683_9STRA|nr:hypothetical protein PF009_g1043 [Phytophthora fragariae]KAE9030550.1 hypothetical protein PF011_g546 [Phytophthora fragariae]KAE9139911.1 hypothetical protein PF007_g819 [Phytophthora fragariae]KAE9155424.1 hypothetical protein PF006_g659 [Phytophthora fragariae]KAE9237079.1 hypothetical protein PF005_g775 [Phytophthora fragariae]
MNVEQNAAVEVPESAAQSGDGSQVLASSTSVDNSTNGKKRKLCDVEGCKSAVRSRGLCKAHGGGTRCKVDGCKRGAQGADLCIAHGGGPRCGVPYCRSAAQSRGLCKKHGGGIRCEMEGCTKSSQGNGFCRRHGGGYKCKHPRGCRKWAQAHGLCAEHIGLLSIENRSEEHQSATNADAPGDVNQAIATEAALPPNIAALCRVPGCTGFVDRKRLCRFHRVNPHCNFLGGCLNVAHANGMCLTHSNALVAGTSRSTQLSHSNETLSSQLGTNDHATRSHGLTTARQQELQAREYCDAALRTRSAELFSVLGNEASPATRTTARRQQRVAEQYCNEALATCAIRFIRSNSRSYYY